MDLTVPICFASLGVDYSHGAALLSAVLREKGIGTEVCLLRDWFDFMQRLARWDDPFVAFSAVTEADYHKSLPFMRAAKAAGKTVLLGGTWAGLGRSVDECVGRICRGDGETLPDYLLSGDDRLFRERMVCEDLNVLPLPDYDSFTAWPFERGLPETDGKKSLPYVSSRGCPYSCRFCQIRLQPQGVRVRTKVEADLTELRDRYRPDLFFIGDATVPEFSAAWRASWGGFRYPFVCYIRPDITPERLGWLIDRGMVGCAFGIESGDESYRAAVLGKRITDDEVWRTVHTLRQRGIWFVPFFLTGTPGETMAIRTKTAQMAEAVGPYSVTWMYEELGSWAS